MTEINREILLYLNSLLEYPIIEVITLFFSDIPIFFLPVFLIFYWIYYTYQNKDNLKKKELLFIFYWCVIAITINLIIQQFIHLERPEEALKWVWKLLLNHIPDASFPSDHAAVSISFLTWLFVANYKKIGYIFLVATVLMNLSRIILWVHWPFDIIWWMITWISSAIISFKYLKKCKKIDKLNNFIIKIMNYIKL